MMSSLGSTLLGAIAGGTLVAVALLGSERGSAEQSVHGRELIGLRGFPPPQWVGVLPGNIVDQQLPAVRNPHYGMHVIALGKNGSLFHKYQTGPANTSGPESFVPMTDWLVLTPPTYRNTSGVDLPLVFGNNPAVALNADGRIELFVGYVADSLDLWQMYQTDAKDPLAWSKVRPPFCDPAFADCKQCVDKPECRAGFWSDGFTWTTSQQSLWLNPVDQKLRLTWRNFDGHMYEKVQTAPSKSDHWHTDGLDYSVFE